MHHNGVASWIQETSLALNFTKATVDEIVDQNTMTLGDMSL